ncbi:hypothetical protein ZWY2020_049468 [Hordeum vulgare]|nr:hypothetical protein ZWY2020_049468 [Hordeum vulgare]
MVLPMSRATRLVPELPLLRRGIRRPQVADDGELAVPAHFRCPISLELMKDPVTAPTGITYDRESVEGWLARAEPCPVTGGPVGLADLVPNHATRRMIQDWCVANRAERVPTPKVPVAEADAAEVLDTVSAAARLATRRPAGRWPPGPEPSARRATATAAASRPPVPHASSRRLSRASPGSPWKAPAPPYSARWGRSWRHLPCSSRSTTRRGAALPPRRRSRPSSRCSPRRPRRAGQRRHRPPRARLVRRPAHRRRHLEDARRVRRARRPRQEPVSPQATKAALVTAYYLVSGSDRAAARFAELGAVPVVAELLVDADKGTSEKALAMLDGVLCADAGLESARAHALVVPVLVRKMFRVSDMATEFAVSALWRLCRASDTAAAACCAEALRGRLPEAAPAAPGGLRRRHQDRASELLKLLNGFRAA